ncbi:FAD-binding protein [Ilumatobacter nonamiensis]|uniref:FAD-binding protein n=1 Tax=Ilumatobacter nonamiensis TaxID=467093 RepID=UPI00130E73DB|nr:FAD-binding protein [Ilumatobacter nonamiensis]
MSADTNATATVDGAMDQSVDEFAAAVGTSGPVSVAGMATRGGAVEGIRTVRAPAGIVRVDAAEMVVECGAATPVADVHRALAEVGQTVSMPPGGTVGGALAVGASDVTRLGHGPLRDVLLQTRFVGAGGAVTKAGGPTVKNVSGFDLCRLLVGSRGTLGFLGDVILRTRPLPPASGWCTSTRDPFELLATLYRPVSILWDGTTTWIRLDGDPGDLESTMASSGLEAADGPPNLSGRHRWSFPPAELVDLRDAEPGSFVAEIGVGVVHRREVAPDRRPDPAIRSLHDRIKNQFDPTARLNPGIDPLSTGAAS